MAPRTGTTPRTAPPFTPEQVVVAIGMHHRSIESMLEQAGAAAALLREVRERHDRVIDLAMLAAVAGRATA